MAELPFVDTHFHLHDMKRPELRYAWLEPASIHGYLGNIDALKAQHYWIDDFIAESRFHNVKKAIHVQAALGIPDPVEETKWLTEFNKRTGLPTAIVAEVHLARPDAADVMARHMEYPNVRGVRDFGDGRYLIDPAWQAGFSHLAKHDLVSCIDTRITLVDDMMKLAAKFPNTLICIDHCAIPEKRDPEYFKLWRKAMDTYASADNIVMKVSGLGMGDWRWTIDSIRPYVLGCIEAFGTDRIVMGTNWPVDRLFSSYPDVINAYAEIIKGFGRDDQVKLFSANAERIFRI